MSFFGHMIGSTFPRTLEITRWLWCILCMRFVRPRDLDLRPSVVDSLPTATLMLTRSSILIDHSFGEDYCGNSRYSRGVGYFLAWKAKAWWSLLTRVCEIDFSVNWWDNIQIESLLLVFSWFALTVYETCRTCFPITALKHLLLYPGQDAGV